MLLSLSFSLSLLLFFSYSLISLSTFLPFSLSPFLPFSLSPFLPFSLYLFLSLSLSLSFSLSLFVSLSLSLFLSFSLSLSLSLSLSPSPSVYPSVSERRRGTSRASRARRSLGRAFWGARGARAPHFLDKSCGAGRGSSFAMVPCGDAPHLTTAFSFAFEGASASA